MSDSRVNVVGYEMELGGQMSFGHFAAYLKTYHDTPVKIGQTTYVPYVEVIDGYLCGLILLFKNRRTSLATSRDADGKLLVSKESLEDGVNGTEACLFCLNPHNSKGTAITYSGAMTIGRFYTFWKRVHTHCKKHLINAAVAAEFQRTQENRGKIRKEITNAFKGKFGLTVLVTPKDLDTLISLYKRISTIRISAAAGLSQAPVLGPLASLSSSKNVSLGYAKTTSSDAIKLALKTMVGLTNGIGQFSALHLTGKSYADQELRHQLGNNREDFGVLDYDEYVTGLPDEHWSTFATCASMRKLITIAHNHPSQLGAIPTGAHWDIPEFFQEVTHGAEEDDAEDNSGAEPAEAG